MSYDLTPYERIQIAIPPKWARRGEHAYTACCPAHDDRHASLSIRETPEGKLLVKCHAGCDFQSVVRASGLESKDFFPPSVNNPDRSSRPSQPRQPEPQRAPVRSKPRSNDGAPTGRAPRVTLAELAEAKGFPVDFLMSLGVRDARRGGVEIPYFDESGTEIGVKSRTAIVAKEGTYWERGKPLAIYGLENIDFIKESHVMFVVEGETDTWALRLHDLPVLGLPGAANARLIQASHLEGIHDLFVSVEPDRGGENFRLGMLARLDELGFAGNAFALRFADAKDPAEVFQAHPDAFLEHLSKAMLEAEALSASREQTVDHDRQPEQAPPPIAAAMKQPKVPAKSTASAPIAQPEDPRNDRWDDGAPALVKGPKMPEHEEPPKGFLSTLGARLSGRLSASWQAAAEHIRSKSERLLDYVLPDVNSPERKAEAPHKGDRNKDASPSSDPRDGQTSWRLPTLSGDERDVETAVGVRHQMRSVLAQEMLSLGDLARTRHHRTQVGDLDRHMCAWLDRKIEAAWFVAHRGSDAQTLLAMAAGDDRAIAHRIESLPVVRDPGMEGSALDRAKDDLARTRLGERLQQYFEKARVVATETERANLARVEASARRVLDGSYAPGWLADQADLKAHEFLALGVRLDTRLKDDVERLRAMRALAATTPEQASRDSEETAPQLSGDDAAVTFAEEVRTRQTKAVAHEVEDLYDRADPLQRERVAGLVHDLTNVLARETDAQFWIEHRNDGPEFFIDHAIVVDPDLHKDLIEVRDAAYDFDQRVAPVLLQDQPDEDIRPASSEPPPPENERPGPDLSLGM